MTREREGESSGLKGEIRQERKRENWRQKKTSEERMVGAKKEWCSRRLTCPTDETGGNDTACTE